MFDRAGSRAAQATILRVSQNPGVIEQAVELLTGTLPRRAAHLFLNHAGEIADIQQK